MDVDFVKAAHPWNEVRTFLRDEFAGSGAMPPWAHGTWPIH